jgi:hypothetical protein
LGISRFSEFIRLFLVFSEIKAKTSPVIGYFSLPTIKQRADKYEYTLCTNNLMAWIMLDKKV